MPKKIGICINVGGQCPKALKREKQEADVTNFKCEHCGRELKEFKGSNGPDWKKIAIGGVAAAALLGGGAYFAFSGGNSGGKAGSITLNKTTSSVYVGNVDTLKATVTPEDASYTIKWASNNPDVATVNNGVVTFIAKGEVKIGAQVNENKELKAFCDYTVEDNTTALPPAPGNGTDLGYGTWTGAIDENGLPHDSNGRMYFKERQRISPKDDQERYAEAGESIVGEYVHGKLVQGKWYKKDGNIEVIMIGQ